MVRSGLSFIKVVNSFLQHVSFATDYYYFTDTTSIQCVPPFDLGPLE